MSKYIDREAFKSKYLCCGYLPEMSEDEFDKFSAADAVEVVRCKDCANAVSLHEAYGPEWEEGIVWCIERNTYASSYDYCSDGERERE